MTHRLATIIKNNGGHIHTNPETNKSGTVHLGGTPQQMITAEQTIHQAKRATTYLATTITLSLLAYHLGSILSLNS